MKLLYMRSIKEPGGILSDVSAVFIPDHPDLIELSRCATQGAIRPLSLPRKFLTLSQHGRIHVPGIVFDIKKLVLAKARFPNKRTRKAPSYSQ